MRGACLNSLQPYGCEWGIGYLWRWTNWIARLDVTVLGLMLAYVVIVVIHVSYRYHLAPHERESDTSDPVFQLTRRKLVADLSVKAGNVKSIALVAPYVGLVGTCFGIMSAFRGFGMEKHTAMVITTIYLLASLITTAAGLLVAVSGAWSYNYLRVCIMDRLEGGISPIAGREERFPQVAQRLPLAPRLSKLPFAVIAAPVLVLLVAAWTPFANDHPATGLAIDLASAPCDYYGADRLIVLHLTDAGKLLLNTQEEDWNSLAGRLSDVYSTRANRMLYLVADRRVPFQTVADAVDVVDNAVTSTSMSLDITVRLITPGAHCPETVASKRHPAR